MRVQRGELRVGHRAEIDFRRLVGRRPRDAIKAAVGAVPEFVARIVAVLRVDPVDHVDGTVGTVLEIHRHVGRIGREQQVVARVKRLVGGARAHIHLVVQLVTVEVVREEVVAVGVGPVVAEVNHRADMRVAAVDRGRARFAGAAFAAVVARGGEEEVFQLGRKVGAAVRDERRKVAVALIPIVAVADDIGRATAAVEAAAVRHEEVAHAVEIEAPLVAAAGGEDLEFVAHGVITPDRGPHAEAFGVGRAGLADERIRKDAVATVEPAVGPPRKAVERLVRILKPPTIKQHLRRPVGHVVVIFIGNEEQIRRSADPDAAESNLESAHKIQFVRKHFLRLEHAVTVLVLEDHDTVLPLPFPLAVRISIGLGYPESAALVDGHRHGLVKIGLCGDEFGLEPRDELHAGDDFLRGGVGDRGGLRGIVAQMPKDRARGEAREIIDPADPLEGRVTVAPVVADAGGVGRGRDGRRRRRSGRGFHGDRGQFGAAVLRELQIAKLDLHRPGPPVQLQREQAGMAREPGLVVVERRNPRAVEPHFQVRSARDDAVVVPRGRRTAEGPIVLGLAKFLRPPASVGRDGKTHAPGREGAAPAFFVNIPEVAFAQIDVRLIPFREAVGQTLAAKQNARVGVRRSAKAKFRGQLEVGDFALPVKKLVFCQGGVGRDLPGDRAVLDAPQGRVALPPGEGFSVEERAGDRLRRKGRGRENGGSDAARADEEQQQRGAHGAEANRDGSRVRPQNTSRAARQSPKHAAPRARPSAPRPSGRSGPPAHRQVRPFSAQRAAEARMPRVGHAGCGKNHAAGPRRRLRAGADLLRYNPKIQRVQLPLVPPGPERDLARPLVRIEREKQFPERRQRHPTSAGEVDAFAKPAGPARETLDIGELAKHRGGRGGDGDHRGEAGGFRAQRGHGGAHGCGFRRWK